MKPYLPLGFDILPARTRKLVAKYVVANPRLVLVNHSYAFGHKWGLNFINPVVFTLMRKELEELQRIISVPFEPGFAHVHPFTDLVRHIDARVEARQASIITPLYPDEGYAPLNFWDSHDDVDPTHVLSKEEMPALVNTQSLHGLTNNEHQRFNFQLSFGTPYAQLHELHLDGKLFRQAPSWT